MVNYLQESNKDDFLYAVSAYHGSNSRQSKSLNLRLQRFASHVSVIASLHSNGKLSSQQVNEQLKQLWKDLELDN